MNIFSEFLKPFAYGFNILFEYWWVLLPWLFYWMFMELWMDYVMGTYAGKLKWVVLEIIPPKNIEKGPKVMESFFQGLAGVITSYNPLEIYVDGAFVDRFSLEIVGDSGVMHFYIR